MASEVLIKDVTADGAATGRLASVSSPSVEGVIRYRKVVKLVSASLWFGDFDG